MSASDNPLTSDIPKEIPLSRAPLVHVIAQVRFPDILSINDSKFIASFQNKIRTNYPDLQNEMLPLGTLPILQGIPPIISQTVWRFASHPDSAWKVTLAQNFISIDTTAYESRGDFLKRFVFVLQSLKDDKYIKPNSRSRLGLRYVNVISGDDVENIDEFIRPELLGIIKTGMKQEINNTISNSLFTVAKPSGQIITSWGLLQKEQKYESLMETDDTQLRWVFDFDMFDDKQKSFDVDAINQEANAFAERLYTFFRWAVTKKFLTRYGGKP